MNRVVNYIEILSGLILLFMASLTSVSAVTRYLFNAPIPDEYEVSRLSLGVVVCWGMAAAFRHNDHIQLDLFWDKLGAKSKDILSRVGSGICFLAVAFFSCALATKVLDTFSSHIETVDLGLPVWTFFAVAWLGSLSVLVVLAWQVVKPSGEIPDLEQI